MSRKERSRDRATSDVAWFHLRAFLPSNDDNRMGFFSSSKGGGGGATQVVHHEESNHTKSRWVSNRVSNQRIELIRTERSSLLLPPSSLPSFSSSPRNPSTLALLLPYLPNPHPRRLSTIFLRPHSFLNQHPLRFITLTLTKLVPPHLSCRPFLLLLHLARIIIPHRSSLSLPRPRSHLRCSRSENQPTKGALSPQDQREQEEVSLSDSQTIREAQPAGREGKQRRT